MKQTTDTITDDIFDLITGDDDARMCKDIPQAACTEQPRNFLLQVGILSLTKLGDGLIDPKIVLSWLLSALGAPVALISLLVPVREAFSLLPQLFIAARIRQAKIRKWYWVAGGLGQAAAVAGMAATVLAMDGTRAAWGVLLMLTLFSLSRGICSVANKDVKGKTIAKTKRGKLSGYGTMIGGVLVAMVGVYLSFLSNTGAQDILGYFLVLAAVLWLLASYLFSCITEAEGATEGGGNAWRETIAQLALIRTDVSFRTFLIVRVLLISTAVATPFYVALAEDQTGTTLSALGLLMIASSLASAVASAVWGHLADRSSRRVLIAAGSLAGVLGFVVAAIELSGLRLPYREAYYAGLIFVLAVAYSGARLGRKTYLIDLATDEKRASYVAVGNTLIGLALMATAFLGLLADAAGPICVIMLMSGFSVLGALLAVRLPEVE